MVAPAKILIIEDDNLLARRLEKDLIEGGFEVTQIVGNMTNAVASFKKKVPDLALIDVKLNGPEDGIATGRELQMMTEIPIIYITGEPNYLESAKRSEATRPAAFLEKPIRTRELIVQVNLALSNFHLGNLPTLEGIKSEYLVLFVDKEYVNIRQSEILFLEAEKSYTNIFVTTEEYQRLYQNRLYKSLLGSLNLGRLESGLQPYFYRVSRQHIINVMHISRITLEEVIVGTEKIPFPQGKGSKLLDDLNVIRSKRN